MACICLATLSLGFSLDRSSPHDEQGYSTSQQQGTTATSQPEESTVKTLEWTTPSLSTNKIYSTSDLTDIAMMTQVDIQEVANHYVSIFS